jgi:hypothetical protein
MLVIEGNEKANVIFVLEHTSFQRYENKSF